MKIPRITYHLLIQRDILESARNLAEANPGESVTTLIERLLENEIKQYEEMYGELEVRNRKEYDVPPRVIKRKTVVLKLK
jgi:hypothetical protein